MEHQDFYTNKDQSRLIQTKILRQAKTSELAFWFSDLLHGKDWPFPYALGIEAPTEAIINLYRLTMDKELRQKIKRALEKLFRELDYIVVEPDFFADLLTIIGALNIRSLYNEILRLANTGDYQPIEFLKNSLDIHKYLLASLTAMGSTRNSIAVFKRDIYTASYFLLCYQALWEWNIHNAIIFTNPILIHAFKNSEFKPELVISIDTFLRTTGIDYIAREYLPNILPTILEPRELLTVFLEAFLESGFSINFSDDFFYVSDDVQDKISTEYPQVLLPPTYIKIHTDELITLASKELSITKVFSDLPSVFCLGR